MRWDATQIQFPQSYIDACRYKGRSTDDLLIWVEELNAVLKWNHFWKELTKVFEYHAANS